MTFFLTRVIYDDDFLLDEEVVVGYYGGMWVKNCIY